MNKFKTIFILGILFSFLARGYFILNGSEIADIHTLREMGEVTLQGLNPYLDLNYNSYPPLAIYLEIITLKVSTILNIPFYILIKLWPNLADLLTGLIIYRYLTKRTTIKIATFWSLVFLLNPISIVISSAHGQIDSVPTLLTLVAALLLQLKSSRNFVLFAGLTLGLAVAIKPNPLVLLPVFLLFLHKKIELREKLLFILLTILPVMLLLIPFLGKNYLPILSKLFSYSGSNDFGLPAVIKTHYFSRNATYQLPNIDQLLMYSKVIFLLLLTGSMFLLRRSKSLLKLILVTYLLFLSFYFGISAQYLSWILVFAILEKQIFILPYTIFGAVSLLAFYFYINPTILLSQFSTIQPYSFNVMLIYAFSNLLLWVVNIFWLTRIFIKLK